LASRIIFSCAPSSASSLAPWLLLHLLILLIPHFPPRVFGSLSLAGTFNITDATLHLHQHYDTLSRVLSRLFSTRASAFSRRRIHRDDPESSTRLLKLRQANHRPFIREARLCDKAATSNKSTTPILGTPPDFESGHLGYKYSVSHYLSHPSRPFIALLHWDLIL